MQLDFESYFGPLYGSRRIRFTPDDLVDAEYLAKRICAGEELGGLPNKTVFDLLTLGAEASRNDRMTRRVFAAHAEYFIAKVCAEPAEVQLEMARALVPDIEVRAGGFRIHFTHYLGMPSGLAEELRFLGTVPDQGFLTLSDVQWQAFLMLHVYTRYFPRLPAVETFPAWTSEMERVLAPFRQFGINQRRRDERARSKGADQESAYPPCIARFVELARAGRPLTHYERFNLVAFLHYFGKSEADIAALFKDMRNYNERKTWEQIHSITRGRRDNAVRFAHEVRPPPRVVEGQPEEEPNGYFTMGCVKMRSYNICPDARCDGTTPINKYIANIALEKRRARGVA